MRIRTLLILLAGLVRVELTLADGEQLSVQTTRERADLLELDQGQIVWVRPGRTQRFEVAA
jgi:TOBE-like domain